MTPLLFVCRAIIWISKLGEFCPTWDAYQLERKGIKPARWSYILGYEVSEWEPEPRVRIAGYWDGQSWRQEELRARTMSYWGAWWRSFLLAGTCDLRIIMLRRPYSPREWSPKREAA